LIIAVSSIYLKLSQVAVGFVLTLMARDLAYFLGNQYSRIQGPQVFPLPIPFFKEIPFLGQVFFDHNLPVYLSIILIPVVWWYIYKTPLGLNLQSVGEHPKAAYVRGINPWIQQLVYTVCGGALVGIAGAMFSLSVKPGWGRPQGAEGTGWIALALVIFGGWHPVRAAIGAYLFSFLQVMGIYFQTWLPSVPSQVFQVAPFPLMIFTLVLMHLSKKEYIQNRIKDKPLIKPVLNFFSAKAPACLGKPYVPD
jgi:simple sugar transport system permease protein